MQHHSEHLELFQWMRCELSSSHKRSIYPHGCSTTPIEVPISALEAAAKIPDPIDCSTTSCPHSGPTQVLDDRQVRCSVKSDSKKQESNFWSIKNIRCETSPDFVPLPGYDCCCYWSTLYSINSTFSRARWYCDPPSEAGDRPRRWDCLLACSTTCHRLYLLGVPWLNRTVKPLWKAMITQLYLLEFLIDFYGTTQLDMLKMRVFFFKLWFCRTFAWVTKLHQKTSFFKPTKRRKNCI